MLGGVVVAAAQQERFSRIKNDAGFPGAAAAYCLDAAGLDLAAIDVVLMRQDPPFDMAYITATHILEHIQPKTLVVNDPVNVRNAPEKLFVTHFEGVMPPTLISSDRYEILAFRAEHKDIIVKPLFGNGGAGVGDTLSEDGGGAGQAAQWR